MTSEAFAIPQDWHIKIGPSDRLFVSVDFPPNLSPAAKQMANRLLAAMWFALHDYDFPEWMP